MTWLVLGCAAVGLVIGSFLNVVVWRVPRGESVVSPSSHCPGCEAPIRARDNVPVLSWLWLRGRCRGCGMRIPWRYPALELLTGVLFALMAWRFGATWELPTYLYVAGVGVALAAIDVEHHRLPDVLTLPSYPVVGALLLMPATLDGQWDSYLRAWLAAGALFAFYFLLAFVYPAGMGFGDVKLAGVLGLALGWLGWAEVVVGTFLGFGVGAVVGITLVLAGRGGRKTAVPFGPFMLLGALAALWLAVPVADWYLGLLG